MRPLAAIGLAVCLSGGCAIDRGPQTLGGDGRTREVASVQSVEVNFRHVTEAARRCYARFYVEADYFPDTREARVSMSNRGDFFVAALFRIDIRPRDGGSTVSIAYISDRFADAAEKWMQGDYSHCPFV